MKSLLFAALFAGTIAAEAAPATTLAPEPVTITQTTPSQTPMSKEEMKRRRKERRKNGPEVYKGTVAEQRRIVTDAAGSEKEDGQADTPRKERKERKSKKN